MKDQFVIVCPIIYKEKDELADCVKATLLFGLRKSELLGLTEDSIDFQRHTLTIHRTVVKVRTTYEKERTKTQSSRRTYRLNQEMEDFFKGLIEKKKKNRLFYGDTYVHTRYLVLCQDLVQVKMRFSSS